MHAGRIGSAELAELVARRAERQFRLGASGLERLARVAGESGGDPGHGSGHPGGGKDGEVTAHFRFLPGPEGHPQIRLQIRGEVTLVCQRCLEPMGWPVDLDVLLTVVPSEEAVSSVADPFDTVVMPPEGLQPAELVEDEVLSALPLAPMHDPGAGACRRMPVDTQASEPAAGPETHRPFADLRARLGGRKED